MSEKEERTAERELIFSLESILRTVARLLLYNDINPSTKAEPLTCSSCKGPTSQHVALEIKFQCVDFGDTVQLWQPWEAPNHFLFKVHFS